MTVKYSQNNISHEINNATFVATGKCNDGYYLNVMVADDNQDMIICPVDINSITIIDN